MKLRPFFILRVLKLNVGRILLADLLRGEKTRWPCMLKAYVPSKPLGLQRALLANGWQQLQTLGCS